MAQRQPPTDDPKRRDERLLSIIPEAKNRLYDPRVILDSVFDRDSLFEIGSSYGTSCITGLARVNGYPVGVMAKNPRSRTAGAMDTDASEKVTRFMQLCDAFDLPLLLLCDTPGIMVGPEVEKTALVRHAARMFVTGGSGGGVLSSWIVGKTDRFRAAVVAKPVINWYSWVLTADMYVGGVKYWFPGVPWENLDHYMERSPLSLVGNVTTPTMLLTGEEDYRTPMSESEQFYQALKLQGKEASLVRIPGASHGITARPSNLMAKEAYVLGWFERYRRPTT